MSGVLYRHVRAQRAGVTTVAPRDLPDGRRIGLEPLTFGRLRLVIGTPAGWEHGYGDGY